MGCIVTSLAYHKCYCTMVSVPYYEWNQIVRHPIDDDDFKDNNDKEAPDDASAASSASVFEELCIDYDASD